MAWQRPTYRVVDGERVPGAWCHVWRRELMGERCFVDDLIVYADGVVVCGEATELAGLERWLMDGRVALTEPGAPVRVEPAREWGRRRWGEARTVDSFLLEVADLVEELAGRATAVMRCSDAIRRFCATPDDDSRGLLREAYLAIPAHRRIFCLGDMDRLDRPLRVLFTEVGVRVDGDGPVVTDEMHRGVLEYLRAGVAAEGKAVVYADDPVAGVGALVEVSEGVYPGGWPEWSGLFVLRNDYPAPVEYGGVVYPTVLHGYWALSAADPVDRAAIRGARDGRGAREAGGRAVRRADWGAVRLAVMAGLLRAKFEQHPSLAEVLVGTGGAVIRYTGFSDSLYWRDAGSAGGRNWVGRLLELVRAEVVVGRG
ncbi:NADAR family protein [Streptomyces acidiscabies]|uniref:NADAR family protein n=1 Tax=Streptomyces acidiscabies TaxID=42234 RepID=A0AAP6EJ41_9ACTN|nr:NADAR family protein [Streptomyces acidiscabies]MDX2964609.1 NADAR family protein [Streptomyces acidiscabies]MDX3024478.1 NADAR family protein [Streptomyces acidiscabies]MDX3794883.1 NADAR family protein [Streptomyces acidiscabies]